MDDLSGLDWKAKANGKQQHGLISPSIPLNPPLRPTPVQNVLSPLNQSRPASGLSGRPIGTSSPLKAASPANDSFSNLLPSVAQKSQPTLTLQDRQRQLQQERDRQIAEQQARHAKEAQLWDRLGTGVDKREQAQRPIAGKNAEPEDDILAAFNSKATVDKSSHFPPPSSTSASERYTPALVANGQSHSAVSDAFAEDDDDIFGLGSVPTREPKASLDAPMMVGEDDILGDLGKPVEERPPPKPRRQQLSEESTVSARQSDALDRPTAELVEMGFPAETARIAIQETGGNVQAAVSFLLNQAHAESQQKSQARSTDRRQSPVKQPQPSPSGSVPAWMRSESRSGSQPRRPDSSSSAGDRDVSQVATEMGTAFFKSAGSLWKAGRKQVQKAVADFQQEGDSSQPKWMRDTSTESRRSDGPVQPPRPRSKGAIVPQQEVTDEAMLLETGGRPQRHIKATSKLSHEPQAPSPLRGRSPAQVLPERSMPTQKFPNHPTPPTLQPSNVNREQVEQQAAQAYVSSARRRKPTTPLPSRAPEPEVDLFASQAVRPSPLAAASTPSPSKARAPVASKPRPQREIPSISPSALSQSAEHRAKGTEAFKRGDYDTAHQSYTSALSPLPQSHPVMIVVLSNRALTAIKTGDPKMAVSDADRAIGIIGLARGEGEIIDLGTEGQKEMKEFYGKALMRKAEALEAMEKWSDALLVWKQAIEAGTGGLAAVRGRERCTKAANPSAATPKPPSRPPPTKARTAPARPKPATASSADAVKKLREQNAAAEKLDDEKFALSDAVSARIESWRGGKGDNLRALLSTLENVLWEGAGWKKVGMAELVLPNKVKVIYMKAIAKVHPDKIPQDATTEQRMVSGSVFSTLNEAWDKFKSDNGL